MPYHGELRALLLPSSWERTTKCQPAPPSQRGGLCSRAAVPSLQATDTFCYISTCIKFGINCTIHVMCLKHSEIIPSATPSMEGLSSMKLLPGAKKVRDRCSRGQD